jgi:hypothetical protein
LGPNQYLFNSRERVNDKPLPLKWEWPALVTSSRAAAAADHSTNNTYNHECTGMREWLLRHNPPALRDGKKNEKTKKLTNKSKNSETTYKKIQRQDLQRQEL